MTTTVYLRPPAQGETQAEWIELAADQQVLASGQFHWPQDLETLADSLRSKRLIVLLPVSQALVTRVQVPVKQRKHLAQVLPYLLEDQLAGSIDDLHVVPGAALADDGQQVIAVEHQVMQQLLDTLRQYGLSAADVGIDALCLPQQAQQLAVLTLGSEALLRLPDGSAQQMRCADLPALLPLLAGDNTVQLYSADADFALTQPHQREELDHALAALARQASNNWLSLLQGRYATRTAWQAHWLQWRKVAIIIGVAVLVQYAYAVTDWLLLKQRISQLDGAIRSSFTEAFPDQANTPYPVRSMNGYIKQLGSGGAGGFSALLAEIAPVLQQADGISLRGMGFEASSGELRLDLSARDLSALNQLDSRLQQMGFRTDLGQTSAGSGGYSGRMVLQRQSAAQDKQP